jgi:putative CocE/NonD family hydrolase
MRLVPSFLAAALLTAVVHAQPPAPALDSVVYRIPMRDGVTLNTVVFRPRDARGPLPILLTRTPYGVAGSRAMFGTAYATLARDGYVFAFQDIRGRFASGGQFVMNRPRRDRSDAKAVDEATDTHDTIEWLVTHVPDVVPKVGVLGVSYPGWLAGVAALEPHPALAAVSPQAPMTDTWLGDDFFHNGAFRQSYGIEYASDMELTRDQSEALPYDRYDMYDWYLALGSLRDVDARYMKGRVPSWRAFVEHPTYDAFWQARALQRQLTAPTVPTLVVGGWWDQEDLFGPLALHRTLAQRDSTGRATLVMGPWNHGGWNRGAGDQLGAVRWNVATGTYFRDSIQAPWFAHHLKGAADPKLAAAIVFDAGARTWRRYPRWPATPNTTPLWLGPKGALSFTAPARAASVSWTSDPAHPVPYRLRPIELTYDPRGSNWRPWLVEDQRHVAGRPDVLVFQTAPLTEDVTIAGDVVAELVASTTGTDADWVVKLIDVFPEQYADDPRQGGYQLMVASEILRGRHRRSFERAEPIVANRPATYRVDLRGQSWTFRRGHRIMVQVQSSWFPLYDRNPQRFVPNIFLAAPSDFTAQRHTVHLGTAGSRIMLPVVKAP